MSDIIEPVEIIHRPDHSYLRGPKGARGCKREDSTGRPCNKAHFHPLHNLPTLNETLTHDWTTYQGALKHWKPWLQDAMTTAGLPRDLDFVLVEMQVVLPDRRRRDQGNMRGFIEKALGDALAEGGWIPDDKFFPVSHYEFGNCQAEHRPGVRETRLLLMPR